MTELNQKLTKHSQKTLDTGCLHGGKYLCKNLGVKEGGGRLLEGGIFSGAYGNLKVHHCYLKQNNAVCYCYNIMSDSILVPAV